MHKGFTLRGLHTQNFMREAVRAGGVTNLLSAGVEYDLKSAHEAMTRRCIGNAQHRHEARHRTHAMASASQGGCIKGRG